MTRTPKSPAARRLEARKAEVVHGDFDVPASLDGALARWRGVFAVQNCWERGVGWAGELRQGRALADAAKRARVTHVVQSSVASCEIAPRIFHWQSKVEIEAHVGAIGLPRRGGALSSWTTVVPNSAGMAQAGASAIYVAWNETTAVKMIALSPSDLSTSSTTATVITTAGPPQRHFVDPRHRSFLPVSHPDAGSTPAAATPCSRSTPSARSSRASSPRRRFIGESSTSR